MRPALLLALVGLSTVAVAAEQALPAKNTAAATRVATQPLANATLAKASVDRPAATSDRSVPFNAEHPGDTALSQDEHGNWRFRSFPGLSTLYVYEKDTPGKSNCTAPCASAWAPLLASSTENEPVGDWTPISRPDGRHQWAYKGQPVYLRYHNLAPDVGNIERQGFRKLEP
jgi:hypothetical protein